MAQNTVFRDPLIISRVKQYLYENQELYIDITEMADYLQRRYRDYKGKKRGPFRAMVRKAYDEITENLTRQADAHWPDSDDVDIEIDTVPPEFAHGNKRQTSSHQNGNSSDKELIDISSDDDQVKTCTTTSETHKTNEYVPVETLHVSKRPHLSPELENEPNIPVPQESRTDVQIRPNRLEKAKKRPREKDPDINFENLIANKKKLRDMPTSIPSVKFSDIGGNNKVLETVANLLIHIKHPEVYTKLGISPPRGFLLHGPPGCGKTLLAHAIAGELQIPLLKVAAPELVAGISGDSEQRIRELFEQAAAIAPCILFLDEIDAVAPHRANTQREMEKRIVSQLLYCLDELGMKENGNKVLVVGATNRPDSIDPALRRAGRFDREVSLGIPDKDARLAILKVHTINVTMAPEVSLEKIASLTPGFVGADLVALIREASMAAVNRIFNDLKKSSATPSLPTPIEVESTKEEDEAEKKVYTNEKDPIIVEEDLVEKIDTETTKNSKESEATTSTEDQSKSDNTAEQSLQPPESTTDQSPVQESDTTTVAESQTVGQNSEPEMSVNAEAESTDVPIESPADATVSSVENVEKKDQESRLKDILSWLHSEPPLTEEQLAMLNVEDRDFDIALKTVQPSAKREGFATVPDVTWDDIGSLQDIRYELQMTIMAPIRHADHFANLGLTTPTGVLLCGPPGCGKTLLAKAIANEAGINFISVKGPELLNMYVGESEKAVRQCFMRARNSSPCVIFFDELDALCPRRSEDENKSTSRVVNQMLTEMDGVEGRKDVFLMAASNRPDIIDRAVLRPGRLDKILYVGLPDSSGRVDILRALTKNGTRPKLGGDVDLTAIAGDDRCTSYTGADLAAFVREAGVEALREIINGAPGPAEICARHFEAAFFKIKPSVDEKDIKVYEKLQRLYSIKRNQSTDVPMSVELPTDSMEAMET